MNTISVLEKDYKPPERPYSQKELAFMRYSNRRALRLGTVRAEHSKSGHFYLTKHNGRKAKQILETGNPDTGNCSVTWKLKNTPKHLLGKAKDLVAFYEHHFHTEPSYLTYEMVEGETDFYKWLYEEFV